MTGDGESRDPRLVIFEQFLAVFDAWKADPNGPDTPSMAGMAALQHEMLAETIGLIGHEPLVAQFLSVLALSDEWLRKRGEPGTHTGALILLERGLALLRDIGVALAAKHVFYAAVRGNDADLDKRTEDVNVGVDAEGAAGLLRGEAALHAIVTSLLLQPSLGELLSDDARLQSEGAESLIGRRVRERKRQNRLGSLVDNFRARSILRAHYDAGREGCGWEKAHQRLFPGVAAAETIRDWNKLADQDLRQTARVAGQKAGRQQPLSPREQAMEDHVLRYTVEDIVRGLADLAKNISF